MPENTNAPSDDAYVQLFDAPGGGTFFFPPPMSTAEECLEFWTKVPIPDSTAARFSTALFRRQNAQIEALRAAKIEALNGRWMAQNPKPRLGSGVGDWKTSQELTVATNTKTIDALSDQDIDPDAAHKLDILQLIRIAKMIESRPDQRLFPREEELLFETKIELYGGVQTIRDAWFRFDLAGLLGSLSYPNNEPMMLEALASIQAEVRRVTFEIETLRLQPYEWAGNVPASEYGGRFGRDLNL